MRVAAVLSAAVIAGLVNVEYVALALAIVAICLAALALSRVNDAVRDLEEVTTVQATAAEELLSSAQAIDSRIRDHDLDG